MSVSEIKDYKIVLGRKSEVEAGVRQLLAQGWELAGGVAFLETYNQGNEFAQALILPNYALRALQKEDD